MVQFSVKHEQDIDCGGGYLKVFDCKLNQKDMHGETPYEIMFGPDICGPGTKKVSYKDFNNVHVNLLSKHCIVTLLFSLKEICFYTGFCLVDGLVVLSSV